MSGTSYTANCPRCGGKETIVGYADWRPFDMVDGICLRCGFRYYTKMEIADKETLKEARKEYEFEDKPLTEEEKKRCKDFDDSWNLSQTAKN